MRDRDRPGRARYRARLRRPEPKNHRKRAGPGPPGFAFTPASRDGPPGGYGTWRLHTPGNGPDLLVILDPLPTQDCDHRFESRGHDPGVKLRHLSQIRHATCTSPICRRPARQCDFEHNTPYEAGGRTCLCNGGPKCRHDHRLKQHPKWKVDQLPDGTFRWSTPAGRTYPPNPRDPIEAEAAWPLDQPGYDRLGAESGWEPSLGGGVDASADRRGPLAAGTAPRAGWNGRPRRCAPPACMPGWAATTRSTWWCPPMTTGATRPRVSSTPVVSPRWPGPWPSVTSPPAGTAGCPWCWAATAALFWAPCWLSAAGPLRPGFPGWARGLPASRR